MKWSDSDLAAAEFEVGQRLHDLTGVIVRVLVRAASEEINPKWGRSALVEGAVLQVANFRHVFRELS